MSARASARRCSAAAFTTGSRCSARAREGRATLRARRGDARRSSRPARSARSATRSATRTRTRSRAALDELAAAYERGRRRARGPSGCPSSTREAIALLEARRPRPRRHRRRRCRSSSPTSSRASVGDLDWDTDVDPAELGRINDLAYGCRADAGIAAGARPTPPGRRTCASTRPASTASPACVLGTIDHDQRPRLLLRRHRSGRHRGHGLASA